MNRQLTDAELECREIENDTQLDGFELRVLALYGDDVNQLRDELAGIGRDDDRTCPRCHETLDEPALTRAAANLFCEQCAVTGVMGAQSPTSAAGR